jgi:CsoR family transcriptional regulator, copper-sensing transcriptional repressor
MEEKDAILQRLKTIEGHLRGVQRMVEEDRYCVDIIKQTKAIQSALDRVSAAILQGHLQSCVKMALNSGDEREQKRVIAELMDVYDLSGK